MEHGLAKSAAVATILAIMASFSASCAPKQPAEVGGLLQRGRSNELLATSELRGKDVTVRGRVTYAGLRKAERTVAEWQPGMFGHATAVASRQSVQYPYLHLVDERQGGDDGLYCYFPSRDMAEVAAIPIGAVVTVSGKFQEFTASDGRFGVVLHSCELDD
jgi:hypothetical protein